MYKAAKAYPGSYSVRIRGSVCTTQVRRRSFALVSLPLAPGTGCAGTVQRGAITPMHAFLCTMPVPLLTAPLSGSA